MLEVLYHSTKFGGARISPAAGAAKALSFFVCLSVCLSVTFLYVRVCALEFSMKALEYRNDFDVTLQGKVCSCALVFYAVQLSQTAANWRHH